MKDFRNLVVWQKAHSLAVEVYKKTGNFPHNEVYGLTSQIRRAATSVPANIAEGCGRKGEAEFGRFLHIATGSACELEYHFLLARDLHYWIEDDYVLLNNQICEIKRMITVLIQKLKADS